jgi:hypothetical protein
MVGGIFFISFLFNEFIKLGAACISMHIMAAHGGIALHQNIFRLPVFHMKHFYQHQLTPVRQNP